MKIRYQKVAEMERGYSIALVPGADAGGESAFVAGSEGKDALVYFEPPDYKPRVIAREPGGFISLAPLVWKGRRYVVASTRFYPFFEAAGSVIRLYPLDEGECPSGSEVAVLPYAHRIGVHEAAGRAWLLASTLCGGKADKDDWSQPGGIHLLEVPEDPAGPWPGRQIVSGLNKNHGMDPAVLGPERERGWLLSAQEGLLFMPVPGDPDGPWRTRVIDRREHSDAFAFDWVGPGETEVFSISPFHGNVLARHCCNGNGWEREIIDDDLAMGHIVWAGNLLGEPGLLAGSRREGKELRLYRPDANAPHGLRCTTLEEGIGPSQMIVVTPGDDRAILYMAAHGVNEIRVYHLEK
ncbi:MAG: hypothetical protein JJU00_13535 [Opitutales bacterium]|nr:hypothetical protein [Opitutales bacterium]